ncbi:hypothetical protein NDN08_006151 [Rhodosorus marinus]|uniref:Tyrosyl-DNA phosphodiesterase 1 n=1 Tax=Rhodosorus marinus TaxID=101924 RepID=A0AAV8UQH1_9RHOD|nr:hypothetical protein NDN08_006151 [Rhodosorus marinus]
MYKTGLATWKSSMSRDRTGDLKIFSLTLSQLSYPGYPCSLEAKSLVASVPGRHTGLDLHRFGHMRVRNLLSKEQMDVEAENAPLVCQYSSLGSLQESWLLHEFKTSLSSRKGGGIRANRAPIQLVWPTVEQVRTSLAGYSSGGSLPCPQRNLKPFLSPLFHRWDGSASNRTEAMPHIKTYLRHSDGKLHFFMLTSANLSGAAWGKLEKGGSQLFVRSYELGVLFLPSFYTESSFSLSASRPCRGLSDGKYEFSGPVSTRFQRMNLMIAKFAVNAIRSNTDFPS